MDRVKFVETAFKEIEIFKGCLPEIFLGPFLNTLFHLDYRFLLRYDISFEIK